MVQQARNFGIALTVSWKQLIYEFTAIAQDCQSWAKCSVSSGVHFVWEKTRCSAWSMLSFTAPNHPWKRGLRLITHRYLQSYRPRLNPSKTTSMQFLQPRFLKGRFHDSYAFCSGRIRKVWPSSGDVQGLAGTPNSSNNVSPHIHTDCGIEFLVKAPCHSGHLIYLAWQYRSISREM